MAFTPKACLFDLDGVIVDTAKYHFTGWKRLADELGIPYTHEDNEQLKGVSRVGSLEYILEKGGLVLDNDTKVRLMERKNAQYLELVETMSSAELFPGVVDFIDELLGAGVKVGLGPSRSRTVFLDENFYMPDEVIKSQNAKLQLWSGLNNALTNNSLSTVKVVRQILIKAILHSLFKK